MRIVLLALSLVLAAPAIALDGPPAGLPAWLAGAWELNEGEEWADEFWSPPRGEIMMGAGRSGKGTALGIWEHTRIMRKPDGSLSFFAQPRGVSASEFPMIAQGPQMIEFANPAHDYPQRIRYWRENGRLLAEISLFDGGKAQRWSYAPMGQ